MEKTKLPFFTPMCFFERWFTKLGFSVSQLAVLRPCFEQFTCFVQKRTILGHNLRVDGIACVAAGFILFAISRNFENIGQSNLTELEKLVLPEAVSREVPLPCSARGMVLATLGFLLGASHISYAEKSVSVRLLELANSVFPFEVTQRNFRMILPQVIFNVRLFCDLYKDKNGVEFSHVDPHSVVVKKEKQAKQKSLLSAAVKRIDTKNPDVLDHEKRLAVQAFANDPTLSFDDVSHDDRDILCMQSRLIGDESVNDIMNRRAKRPRVEFELK
eukprot:TRINITY_DN2089_c0_g1_i1.p1 TRINITY_DN2089_c0_g1~~TRINITY_DN2089_c0_g1_i1.p1  ORF type:complete len:273 (+),score=61.89 TRINITY_DN2089_c0_g1_i1:620-1438(+)